MKAPPFRTNPSTIARYFFHDCQRFFYFSSASPAQRKKEHLPTPEFDHSPLIASILASGHTWEQEVIENLLAGRVIIAPGSGELHTRRHSPAESLHHLQTASTGRFLYQATLVPPPAFYQQYGLDRQLVAISDNHPDLIEVLPDPQGGRLFRILDVKRGEGLRLTHRVQILFYALELQALLDAEGIAGARVDLGQGGVWLGKHPAPELFGLGDFLPHLERFLRDELMAILRAGAREVEWHLYARCEWCEFFGYCREEMRERDDVSRLPLLTTYGKRHLKTEANVQSLTELGRFLKRGDADEVLERCASLAGKRHRLETHVAALEHAEPRLHGSSSTALPQGENVALFLTLQQEPLGKVTYLAGVYLTAREDIRQDILSPLTARLLLTAEGRLRPAVWVASKPEDAVSLRQSFVLFLHDLLQQVHQYNQQRPEWKKQLSLQVYVQAEDERRLLFACLLEALQDQELAGPAMTLLFHFQGPELMHADSHPGSEVAYPVVVLLEAVSQLLALPVEVSYTLPEMLAALRSSFSYSRRDYYHFQLGHNFRAESLHAAWYQGKRENLVEIEEQGRLYLLAIAALLRAVRERAGQHLHTWPPKFTLPAGAGLKDRLLSRLSFFARYESLLRCLAIREARVEARPTQVLLGQAIELEALDATTMEVRGELIVEPEAGGFPAWLLVRDSEEGRRAQVEYADYWYRNKFHGGPDSPHRAVAGVESIATEGIRARLKMKYARAFKGEPPQRGERFLLYPRFTDFTTDESVRFLARLDADADLASLFLESLRDPASAARAVPLEKRVSARATLLLPALGFTPSQAEAFTAIGSRRVTAVWGPPGTGKTHFLATAIVALAAAHAHAGQPFRVLVTAFTHAAIENLLRKIALVGAGAARLALPALAKAKYWQGSPAGIEVVADDEAGDWLESNEQAVLGATAFTALKKFDQLPRFELVVIDEASQVRVPEAAVAFALVAPAGRIVLAGDHLQLPPIIAGSYPESTDGTPPLHRSIFEVVSRLLPGTEGTPGIVRQLLENFRMNDVLTSFAGRLLYGPGYRCATPTVARRRLPFKPARGTDLLVKACLDPKAPLTVVVLDGVRAARANPIEADLVAQLVTALRQGLLDEAGNLYRDDADFFRHGVFVVSPHHAQINAIQRELAKLRPWSVTPFVDTVDRMQGQEADAVLISYGVSDPEFALKEAEFIYGLNRLNVALTRARSKTVLCLPRPLLEASPQVLDVPAAAKGLAFMRRLVSLVEATGEVEEFEAESFEARVLRASHPLS